MEEWKKVKGFEELYEVSSFGNVRSVPRKIISKNGTIKTYKKYVQKKLHKDRNGYLKLILNHAGKHENKWVHRLVAEAFLSNDNGHGFVNHKDSDKTNNNVFNLEWITMIENNWHSNSSKLNKHDVHFIRDCISEGQFTTKELSDMFPIKEKSIKALINGETWKDLRVLN